MGMTNRELGEVLASTLVAPLLGVGGFLTWNGWWGVGIPLVLSTVAWTIWRGRRRSLREADEAIARAAAHDADELGRADGTHR